MNVLFVCSGNKLRSPTAEKVFSNVFNTRSAGTSKNSKRQLNIDDIKWSDQIFVMEEKHKQRILSSFPRAMEFKRIEVLNILDNYKYMQNDLISILKEKVNLYSSLFLK
jgi:predicted protein tyrosine phosphatase